VLAEANEKICEFLTKNTAVKGSDAPVGLLKGG
jgi:hypothetical protein